MSKAGSKVRSEIEACLTGLYGFLLMRLQKKEIYPETTAAISTFSSLLAFLSKRFLEIESGEEVSFPDIRMLRIILFQILP